jgi:hypothetical protein
MMRQVSLTNLGRVRDHPQTRRGRHKGVLLARRGRTGSKLETDHIEVRNVHTSSETS